ncbi:MAG: hypothetical protein RL736_360 [Pseudomonadota bacterium]|jgi:hypothetical protein
MVVNITEFEKDLDELLIKYNFNINKNLSNQILTGYLINCLKNLIIYEKENNYNKTE